MGQEPKRTESVVDRDDDCAVCGELGAVVVAGAIPGKAAAVDPHEHGKVIVVPERRRVDVEIQTVL
jgi:hypothetical protein